jgi:hypothetical protein
VQWPDQYLFALNDSLHNASNAAVCGDVPQQTWHPACISHHIILDIWWQNTVQYLTVHRNMHSCVCSITFNITSERNSIDISSKKDNVKIYQHIHDFSKKSLFLAHHLLRSINSYLLIYLMMTILVPVKQHIQLRRYCLVEYGTR